MSGAELPESTTVDMVFPLAGNALPRDHAQVLRQAVEQTLPWLTREPLAGIHPVKLVSGNDAQGLLSQRTRLLLRLPRRCRDAAAALAGQDLQVGNCRVRPGVPHQRELLPHATLYAPVVAAPSADEASFLQFVAAELETLGVRSHCVCGKSQVRILEGGQVTTFSLMLHGLSAAHSLRLQDYGLGPHRLLGCGIFVPHKSAAAVGE